MSDGSAILIVEDHEESRASLAYALEKRGHFVHAAATGKAALAIARRSELHAAVLDLRLPDMEGVSVLTAILDHAPGLPVVVVTGYASVDTAVAAMKSGAADFLTKPFKLDDLTRVLDRSIARARESGVITGAATPIAREMEHFGILGGSSGSPRTIARC
jgi:DNA-binding NtrC family response regulator